MRNIYVRIAADHPDAADEQTGRITSAALLLRDFPESGKPGRVAGTREFVVTGTPYLVAYRLGTSKVRIVAVMHGAQEWPKTFSTPDKKMPSTKSRRVN
jgi:toxin ParE1/3/4